MKIGFRRMMTRQEDRGMSAQAQNAFLPHHAVQSETVFKKFEMDLSRVGAEATRRGF